MAVVNYVVLPSGDIASLGTAPEGKGGTKVCRHRGEMLLWTETFPLAKDAGLAVAEMYLVDMATEPA